MLQKKKVTALVILLSNDEKKWNWNVFYNLIDYLETQSFITNISIYLRNDDICTELQQKSGGKRRFNSKRVKVVPFPMTSSEGDVYRELSHELDSYFIIINSLIVLSPLNMDLYKLYNEYMELNNTQLTLVMARTEEQESGLLLTISPDNPPLLLKSLECFCATKKNTNKNKKVTIDLSTAETQLRIHTNLRFTHLAFASFEVMAEFGQNFDYHNLLLDYCRNTLHSSLQLLNHSIRVYILQQTEYIQEYSSSSSNNKGMLLYVDYKKRYHQTLIPSAEEDSVVVVVVEGGIVEGLELKDESDTSSSDSDSDSDSDEYNTDYSLSASATSTATTTNNLKNKKKITSKNYDSEEEDDDEDLLEIEETVLRAFKEDFTLENAYLELNSLRMSFNVSVEQVWKILVKLIVLQTSQKIEKWLELVKKFYKDYSQERELLRCIMDNKSSRSSSSSKGKELLKVLALFYNEDLIGDLEVMKEVLKEYENDATLQAFIIQVEKNEEEEDEEESEEE